MERQPFAFFAEIKPIEESSNLIKTLEKEEFYFYYFKKKSSHYIFLYGKNSNYLEILESDPIIIQELNTKKRKIRSVRGFLLHALDLIQDENSIKILQTNFRPRFWSTLKDVLKQNKKNCLLEFLFQPSKAVNLSSEQKQLEKQIETMEEQMLSLKEKVKRLGSKPELNYQKPDSVYKPNLVSGIKPEFKILDQLNENEKEEIIRNGFKMREKDLIKLYDYYEGTQDPNSLYQSKGYCISYETVRKDKFYKRYNDKSYKK
jgi:hypothetical protein